MQPRWMRVVRATLVECGLAAGATALAANAMTNGLAGRASAIAGLGALAIVAGVVGAWRRGRLALAWRCPRLDRAGLSVPGTAAPWAALVAAEAVLEAFDADDGRWRDYFGEARRDVFAAVRRALDLHRDHARGVRALVGAPAGEGRTRLEAQVQEAAAEIHRITGALQELRARLFAATRRQVSSATLPLDAVAARAEVLGESLAAVNGARQRTGGAS